MSIPSFYFFVRSINFWQDVTMWYQFLDTHFIHIDTHFMINNEHTWTAAISCRQTVRWTYQTMSFQLHTMYLRAIDTRKIFFVRPCYDRYYRFFLELLYGPEDMDYISVTGTPRIGKSLFYVYFIQRYRTEYPAPRVSSLHLFTVDRVLEECKLIKHDGRSLETL